MGLSLGVGTRAVRDVFASIRDGNRNFSAFKWSHRVKPEDLNVYFRT